MFQGFVKYNKIKECRFIIFREKKILTLYKNERYNQSPGTRVYFEKKIPYKII